MLPQIEEQQGSIFGVNISTTFPQPIPNFDRFVGPDKNLLIVTSAGNKGLTLSEDSPSYPAVLGGNEVSNLISVAAVDLNRTLVPGSNRSDRLIDIAAWGCGVPVLAYDEATGQMRSSLVSGTSFAAPQVLFAAAMILREQHDGGARPRPVDIKLRLVASADLVPGLFGDVKHGRVLNLEKAVSAHTDLIELVSGGGLRRGRVTFGSSAGPNVKFCGDATLPRGQILKVAKLDPIPPGQRQFLIYSGVRVAGAPPVFREWSCDAIPLTVHFKDFFTGEEETFCDGRHSRHRHGVLGERLNDRLAWPAWCFVHCLRCLALVKCECRGADRCGVRQLLL